MRAGRGISDELGCAPAQSLPAADSESGKTSPGIGSRVDQNPRVLRSGRVSLISSERGDEQRLKQQQQAT